MICLCFVDVTVCGWAARFSEAGVWNVFGFSSGYECEKNATREVSSMQPIRTLVSGPKFEFKAPGNLSLFFWSDVSRSMRTCISTLGFEE